MKLKRQDIIGKNIRDLQFIKGLYPNLDEFWTRFNQIFQKGKIITHKVECHGKAYEMVLKVLQEEGKAIGFTCVLSPERKEPPETGLSPSLIRKITVPLTTIHGFIQIILQEKVRGEELQQYLQIMNTETEHLLQIISEVSKKLF